MVVVENVAFGGWTNNTRLTNGLIELVITGEVGPRVIHCGLLGGRNLFAEYRDQWGKTGGDDWRIYGGHRLWHAPEIEPRTYMPDNGPVAFEPLPDGVRVVQATEPLTGIQKSIEITLATAAPKAKLVHRLTNQGVWPVQLAPWALSVMAPGGVAVLPLPPRGEHPRDLLPASTLTLWTYTNLSDARWTWGREVVLLRQADAPPQKIGMSVPDGWLAYVLEGTLFVKQFGFQPGAAYPDMGCSAECFTNRDMLELESLGPLTTLAPGQTVEHVETWSVYSGVSTPTNDADVVREIKPKMMG